MPETIETPVLETELVATIQINDEHGSLLTVTLPIEARGYNGHYSSYDIKDLYSVLQLITAMHPLPKNIEA